MAFYKEESQWVFDILRDGTEKDYDVLKRLSQIGLCWGSKEKLTEWVPGYSNGHVVYSVNRNMRLYTGTIGVSSEQITSGEFLAKPINWTLMKVRA